MTIQWTSARRCSKEYKKCGDRHILDERAPLRTRKVDNLGRTDTFITCDPYICPANRPFCDRNHENGPGPGPDPDPLDEAENAHDHARSAHEAETSKPSRCADADDIAGATRDGLCHNHHGRRHVDHRPCESEAAAMASDCRRACVVRASPDGDGAAEMVSDCHLARGGGNPSCGDGAGTASGDVAGTASDDGSGGRVSHLMARRNRRGDRNRTR